MTGSGAIGSNSEDHEHGLGKPRRRPTRVLHVAETIAGGIASYFEEIAQHQSLVFGRENVGFVIPSGSEKHLPNIEPAQIITFAPPSRRPAGLLALRRVAIQAIRDLKPDVLHLHSSFAGAIMRATLRAPANSPRVIYCPHGWSFGMEAATYKKWLYALVERRLARETDLILVNSESEHELALRFGLPARKLKIVKNGIAWTPAPGRKDNGSELRLAFIGRHDRQKGLDLLLETIERFSLKNIHFDVVGESVLERSVRSGRRSPRNVTFHGWLDRAAIARLLDEVDAVVMPSRWEAFGLVAIEAMRAGVPVIASNRGALPEVVADGIGGYIFDIDDENALGLLLARLTRKELTRLGRSARERWESEFDAARMNRLIRLAYESVLSEAPSYDRVSAVGSPELLKDALA